MKRFLIFVAVLALATLAWGQPQPPQSWLVPFAPANNIITFPTDSTADTSAYTWDDWPMYKVAPDTSEPLGIVPWSHVVIFGQMKYTDDSVNVRVYLQSSWDAVTWVTEDSVDITTRADYEALEVNVDSTATGEEFQRPLPAALLRLIVDPITGFTGDTLTPVPTFRGKVLYR